MLYLTLSLHENSNIFVAHGFYNSSHPPNKSDLNFAFLEGLFVAILRVNLCEQLFSHQIEDHGNDCQAKKKINTSENQLEIAFDLNNEEQCVCV